MRTHVLGIAVAALMGIATAGCQTTTKQLAVAETPIEIKAQETTKPIAFKKIVIKMPRNKEVGKIGGGILCLPMGTLVGRGSRSALDPERFNDIFREELIAANYEVVGDPDQLFGDPDLDRAEYFIAGLIVDAELNSCFPMAGWGDLSSGSGAAYLDVEWQIFDTLRREVVLTLQTQGSGKVDQGINPADTATDEAFAIAVNNLLANEKFYNLVRKSGTRAPAQRLASSLSLIYDANPGVDYDRLKHSVATIRSSSGHGSGFLVTRDTLITNAHVVGQAEKVRVVLAGGIEVEGKVTARDPIRDVATIEVAFEGPPLSISSDPPVVGDEVFSIGTPLDEDLAGTMRKGIVSANRTLRDKRYLQADVALNPGNSGGPLLDIDGNVVGVAVAGVMVGHSQQDLNFFIPIDEALLAVLGNTPQS